MGKAAPPARDETAIRNRLASATLDAGMSGAEVRRVTGLHEKADPGLLAFALDLATQPTDAKGVEDYAEAPNRVGHPIYLRLLLYKERHPNRALPPHDLVEF